MGCQSVGHPVLSPVEFAHLFCIFYSSHLTPSLWILVILVLSVDIQSSPGPAKLQMNIAYCTQKLLLNEIKYLLILCAA